MIYSWIIGGLAALDLAVKAEIEAEEVDTFPRDLPAARGWIRLHRNHNSGFPFGVLRRRPDLVKGLPLMVVSALIGALAALSLRKGALLEKLGLAVTIGGALSNTYDRLVRGYVVDYFTIEWKKLRQVVFNLGDLFIFVGALLVLAGRCVDAVRQKKGK